MRQYAQLGNLVMSKHITISHALMEAEKIEKMNVTPSTLEEGEECLVKIESLHKTLSREKCVWDDGRPSWEVILKELQGAPNS